MPYPKVRIKTRREFVKDSAIVAGIFTLERVQIFPTLEPAVDKDATNNLKGKFSGHLITPGDPGYDAARKVLSMNPEPINVLHWSPNAETKRTF